VPFRLSTNERPPVSRPPSDREGTGDPDVVTENENGLPTVAVAEAAEVIERLGAADAGEGVAISEMAAARRIEMPRLGAARSSRVQHDRNTAVRP